MSQPIRVIMFLMSIKSSMIRVKEKLFHRFNSFPLNLTLKTVNVGTAFIPDSSVTFLFIIQFPAAINGPYDVYWWCMKQININKKKMSSQNSQFLMQIEKVWKISFIDQRKNCKIRKYYSKSFLCEFKMYNKLIIN